VWLVPLAPVQDPLLVSEAVFRALGAHDLSAGWSVSALSDYLAGKRLLLVLDNCEHLLDACAVLAGALLKNCPDLQLLATKTAPPAETGPHTGLTRRELEIARLVADDLTNKQIAAMLFLSQRTVDTHITNILNKLGLGSRVQLGRWIADTTR